MSINILNSTLYVQSENRFNIISVKKEVKLIFYKISMNQIKSSSQLLPSGLAQSMGV